MLYGRRIDDTIRRVSKVLLLPCQREFLSVFIRLKEL